MGMLDGKCALITGAGSGFGRAGAMTFAREGAKVAVVDMNADTGSAVVKAIRDAGGEAVFIRADMSKMEDVERMMKEAIQAHGRLDIFWHNAGNVGPGSIEETSYEAYDVTMTIHVKAGFFGAKLAVAEMKKVGGGVILFTSSLAGLKTSRASTTYGIAKAALVSLTKNLTLSFAPYNVRVNAICPGAAETAMWLVQQHAGVRGCIALALGARRKQELTHRGAHANTHGHDVVWYVLHGVVNGHTGSDRTARRVDV